MNNSKKDDKKTPFIQIIGAKENNLKNINVKIPLGVLCGISGVSGSGKSSLINLTLVPHLKKHLGLVYENLGKLKNIEIDDLVKDIVVIDQSPIGRTPRSNPATYIKVFDDIRRLFAMTKESKARGYKEGRFSFNVYGGRCEECKGDGTIKIEMNFLPDVEVICDKCKGKRYNKETLEILYRGKSIADILDMEVSLAAPFFENHIPIQRKIKTLLDVGLGYIKLGQSSTTLSGGESQRIKLTKELSKFKSKHTIYVLDEPTTGLHFEDIKKLLDIMNKIVDRNNSIIVIEHNLDVLKFCDYIIDIGPEGGDRGGEIIEVGTPEKISQNKRSHTGKFLKKILKNK